MHATTMPRVQVVDRPAPQARRTSQKMFESLQTRSSGVETAVHSFFMVFGLAVAVHGVTLALGL